VNLPGFAPSAAIAALATDPRAWLRAPGDHLGVSCSAKTRDEEVIRRLAIDPHSPGEFRCNQIVRNLDEFYGAFGVGADDKLWLEPAGRVRIW
jgi:hypothetical protein